MSDRWVNRNTHEPLPFGLKFGSPSAKWQFYHRLNDGVLA
jgi:hypothetical protein